MKNTARRPEPEVTFGTLLRAGAAGAGMAIARNPIAVGGATAFAVAFSFVSANALWYQPHFHAGALISTREPVFVETTPAPTFPAAVEDVPSQAPRQIAPDRDTTGAIPVQRPDVLQGGDPVVRKVQKVLEDLGLYHGTIDGLQGAATRTAIGNYRRIVGLDSNPVVDEALLRQLGLSNATAATEQAPGTPSVVQTPTVVPIPTPRPAYQPQAAQAQPAMATRPQTASVPVPAAEVPQPRVQTAALAAVEADPTIMRVQAGLKAFGNDAITVDGILGQDTQTAIREFQSLFGLPVTGRPDDTFLAKMREVGLTN